MENKMVLLINKLQKSIGIDFSNYTKNDLKSDSIGGLTVAIVAIPQCMAFAIIAGVNPIYGLYAAVVATILGAIFGSSNHMITGPANVISILIANVMSKYIGLDEGSFYQMLFTLTFVVGCWQLLFGLLKLDKVIEYVSHSVIVGFSSGAGVIIALGQIPRILGIPISGQTSPFEKLTFIINNLGSTQLLTLLIGLLTIALIIIIKKINKNLPNSLIAMVIASIFVLIFSLEEKGVEIVGEIKSALPAFKMIDFKLENISEIAISSLTIGVIGLVASISISKTISLKSKQSVNTNREFIGQGLANIGASFFQSFPSAGSFTRSAINFHSGSKTKISGILAGIITLALLLFFSPLLKYIPYPSLAGIIIIIAIRLVAIKDIQKITKTSKSDSIAMWVTFIGTILLPELQYAIYLGVLVSIILFLGSASKVNLKILRESNTSIGTFDEIEIDLKEKKDVLMVQIEGNLFFGLSDSLKSELEKIADRSKVYILRLKRVTNIDMTALEILHAFIKDRLEKDETIILSGLKDNIFKIFDRAGIVEEIGRDNIFQTEDEIFSASKKAIEKAKSI